MAIYVTQIEKHKFVCGLFWQSLSRPRELVKEARELGAKINFDLMVVRYDQATAQAGFAHTVEGARRGMFSLGAVVSKTMAIEGAYYDGRKQRVHNWLAALKLPDGKWAYFAVRDANFLPNGDFAGTKEEVLERLHGDYGLGGWNVVIGDEELADYGFHNFEVRTVADLIPRRRDGSIRVHRWWGLLQRQPRQRHWPLAAAAALATVVAGVACWQHYQHRQEELRLERLLAAARQEMQKQRPPAQPLPWDGKPAPLSLARACADRLSYLTPGGWQLDNYECTGDRLTYAWSRRSSTLGFLLAEVPGATVDPNGDKASYSEPLQLERQRAEALIDGDKLLQPVVSALQLMGAAYRITSVPTKAANTAANNAVPAWHSYAFKINARGLAPAMMAAALDKPGVRIDRLAYRAGEWSIEGVMYAK